MEDDRYLAQEPEPASIQDIIDLYQDNVIEQAKVATKAHCAMVQELRELDAEIKALTARKAYLKNQLACYLLRHTCLVNEDGQELVTFKVSVRETIDAKSFKAAYPLLADKFATKTVTRVFLLKKGA